jgi:hypothetical protein
MQMIGSNDGDQQRQQQRPPQQQQRPQNYEGLDDDFDDDIPF